MFSLKFHREIMNAYSLATETTAPNITSSKSIFTSLKLYTYIILHSLEYFAFSLPKRVEHFR